MTLNLFTRPEFVLPHPPLFLGVLLVVEDAIRIAWEILLRDPPDGFDMNTAKEATINHHLRETLQDRVWKGGLVDGFDGQVVACVTSAEEVRNYDGSELSKKPDMLVKLVSVPSSVRPSQHGVFIECKPVDKKHRLDQCYCKLGIERFVDGRYAWAMRDGMMVGYTRGGEMPMNALGDAIQKCRNSVRPVGKPAPCPHSVPRDHLQTVVTRHARGFSYVETGSPAPEILLRHVWLRRSGNHGTTAPPASDPEVLN